jgi:hypothetical protein
LLIVVMRPRPPRPVFSHFIAGLFAREAKNRALGFRCNVDTLFEGHVRAASLREEIADQPA